MIKDSNVTVMVMDLDKSVSFYQSIGFELKNKWGNFYAQLVAPGITLGLHPASGKATGSGALSIGFTTDNFESEKVKLQNLSIDFQLREEEGGQFLHFGDLDGTQLYFIKPKW